MLKYCPGAAVVKLAYTSDLKSDALKRREGSTPSRGTQSASNSSGNFNQTLVPAHASCDTEVTMRNVKIFLVLGLFVFLSASVYLISNYYLSKTTNTQSKAESVGVIPPDDQRLTEPAGAVLLQGGKGMSNGAAMKDGNFQVEGYCSVAGLGAIRFDGSSNWYCGNVKLGVPDFDAICHITYKNSNAFAIRSGTSSTSGYNWRCFQFSGATSVFENACGKPCSEVIGLCQAGSTCRYIVGPSCTNNTNHALPTRTYCVPDNLPTGWSALNCVARDQYNKYVLNASHANPTVSELTQACATAQATPTPTISPTPTPTATPNCSVPPVPTNLAPVGAVTPTRVTLSWSAVAGASRYILRVDDQQNAWNGQCQVNAGDICVGDDGKLTATSYTFTAAAGHSYNWWVQSVNDCGASAGVNKVFTVTAATTPTPIPAPTKPVVVNGCNSSLPTATITWTGAPVGYDFYVDIAASANFDRFYHKKVTSIWSTDLAGFKLFVPNGEDGELFIPQAAKTYYVRVYNGTESEPASFTTNACGNTTFNISDLNHNGKSDPDDYRLFLEDYRAHLN